MDGRNGSRNSINLISITKTTDHKDGATNNSHNVTSQTEEDLETPEVIYIIPETSNHTHKYSNTKQGGYTTTPTDDAAESSDDDFDKDDEYEEGAKMNIIARVVVWIQQCVIKLYTLSNKLTRGLLMSLICLIAYIVYFIIAMCHEFGSEGSHRLLGCTTAGILILLRSYIHGAAVWIFEKIYGAKQLSVGHDVIFQKCKFFIRWLMYGVLAAIAVWTLVKEGIDKPNNLRSIPGLVIFFLVSLLFSTRPDKINWHTIYWSMGLQFLLALIVLKWKTGQDIVVWIQDRFDEYFSNTEDGAVMLFGPGYEEHNLIFAALPRIFYISATLAVLYYIGAMKLIIGFLGKTLKFCLDISLLESSSVAINIFSEGVLVAILLRPFMAKLSKSQMFVILIASFSSLGGTYVAILASMGVSLKYVIPSMLLSAPASIAVCKLMFPETKDKKGEEENTMDVTDHERKKYANLLDAVQTGAINVISLMANIAVTAYVIYSLIGWINSTLTWFGDRVGVENLTIELTCSYVLYPVAYVMGIEPEDCKRVAMLIGYRIGFINFLAFLKLAGMKMNKFRFSQYMTATNFTGPVDHYRNNIILVQWNETLTDGFISERSEAITTYVLCGFSSILSVAMTISLWCVLVPKRKIWLTKMAIPVLVASNIANLMTGCFASIFTDDATERVL